MGLQLVVVRPVHTLRYFTVRGSCFWRKWFIIERHCTPAVGPVTCCWPKRSVCAADTRLTRGGRGAGPTPQPGRGGHTPQHSVQRPECRPRAPRRKCMGSRPPTVTELSIQLIRALYLRHDYSQRTTALYKHYYTVTIQLCIAIQLYTRYKSTPLCLTPAHAPAPTRRWEYDREGEGIKRAPDRTGRRWV